jgi:hypothetical protein
MVKYEHRRKTSKPFVSFWESLTSKEGARERAHYVLKPINEYHNHAKKILEIGCGIGESWSIFQRDTLSMVWTLKGITLRFAEGGSQEASSLFPACITSRLMKNLMPYSLLTMQSTF